MGDNNDRTIDRGWEIINELDDFIDKNDKKEAFTLTRKRYWWNYIAHLSRLYQAGQIFVQRDKINRIIGICTWVLVNKEDEHKINKITWSLPKEISNGNNLCITICVLNGGSIHDFRREFRKRFSDKVDEVFWFDIPHNRFIRRKNILKEMVYADTKLRFVGP